MWRISRFCSQIRELHSATFGKNQSSFLNPTKHWAKTLYLRSISGCSLRASHYTTKTDVLVERGIFGCFSEILRGLCCSSIGPSISIREMRFTRYEAAIANKREQGTHCSIAAQWRRSLLIKESTFVYWNITALAWTTAERVTALLLVSNRGLRKPMSVPQGLTGIDCHRQLEEDHLSFWRIGISPVRILRPAAGSLKSDRWEPSFKTILDCFSGGSKSLEEWSFINA